MYNRLRQLLTRPPCMSLACPTTLSSASPASAGRGQSPNLRTRVPGMDGIFMEEKPFRDGQPRYTSEVKTGTLRFWSGLAGTPPPLQPCTPSSLPRRWKRSGRPYCQCCNMRSSAPAQQQGAAPYFQGTKPPAAAQPAVLTQSSTAAAAGVGAAGVGALPGVARAVMQARQELSGVAPISRRSACMCCNGTNDASVLAVGEVRVAIASPWASQVLGKARWQR